MATMQSWRLGQCQQKAQRHFKAISVRPSVVLTDQENLNRWTFNQLHIFGPLCDVCTVDFKLLKQIPPRLSIVSKSLSDITTPYFLQNVRVPQIFKVTASGSLENGVKAGRKNYKILLLSAPQVCLPVK